MGPLITPSRRNPTFWTILGNPVVPFCPFWALGSLVLYTNREKGHPYCNKVTGLPSIRYGFKVCSFLVSILIGVPLFMEIKIGKIARHSCLDLGLRVGDLACRVRAI